MSRKDARIPLDGFNDYCRHFVCRHVGAEGGFDIFCGFLFYDFIWHIFTVEGEVINFRKEGSHLCMHPGGAGGHGAGTVGISMVSVDEGDDLRAPCVGPGKFHGRIVTVGSTVAEGDLRLHAAGIYGSQLFRIGNHGFIVGIGCGVLGALLELCLNGLCENGVRTSQVQGRRTGEEIDIFITVGVLQDFTLSAFHGKGIIGQVLAGSYHFFIPGHKG